jgi:hypothetical protein
MINHGLDDHVRGEDADADAEAVSLSAPVAPLEPDATAASTMLEV